MGKDATSSLRLALRIVFDDESKLVALVAVDVQVAPHRLGRSRGRGGADDSGVDDTVVERRAADVHAVVAGCRRQIAQGGVPGGRVTERRSDRKHTGRRAAISFLLLGSGLRRVKADAPGGAGAADDNGHRLAHRNPVFSFPLVTTQHSRAGIPIGGCHHHHLADVGPLRLSRMYGRVDAGGHRDGNHEPWKDPSPEPFAAGVR